MCMYKIIAPDMMKTCPHHIISIPGPSHSSAKLKLCPSMGAPKSIAIVKSTRTSCF